LVYVVLAICCGLSAAVIGKIKGSSFWIWFLIGLCLPLLGTITAVLYRFEQNESLRQCPDCGNVVPLHDQVCMQCGCDLAWPAQEPAGDRV
jgi:hypothetical protein